MSANKSLRQILDFRAWRKAWSFYLYLALLAPLPLFAVFIDLLSPPLGGYADQRFVLCAALFGLGALSIGAAAHRNVIWSRLSDSWPLLLFSSAFIFLSLPYVGQQFLWVEPGLYALFFAVVAMAGAVLAEDRSANEVALVFTILVSGVCFLYGAMTVNVYLFALSDDVRELTDFIPWGFVNIRYWSHTATWLLPLLPVAVISIHLKKYALWRGVVVVAAGLWWWIVILSMARGTIVALAFGSICALAIFRRFSFPWFRCFAVQILAGAVFWFVLSVAVPSFLIDESGLSLRGVSFESSARWVLFGEAWRMSLENFPFGLGPQSWLTHEALSESYESFTRFGHPHNMFLMWAAEYGWILVLVLVGVALKSLQRIFTFINSLPERPERGSSLVVGLTVSVIAAFSHAFVSAVFIAPASMLVGIPVLILFWAILEPQSRASNSVGPAKALNSKKSFSLFVLLGFFLSVFLWFNNVVDYYEAMRADEAFYQDSAIGGLAPRFWFHGNYPRSAELMADN